MNIFQQNKITKVIQEAKDVKVYSKFSGIFSVVTGSTFDPTNLWIDISGNTQDISDLSGYTYSIVTGTTFDPTNLWEEISGNTQDISDLSGYTYSLTPYNDTNVWIGISGNTQEINNLWNDLSGITEYDDTNLWETTSGNTQDITDLSGYTYSIPVFDPTNLWIDISGNTQDISDLTNEFDTFTGTTYPNDLNDKLDTTIFETYTGTTAPSVFQETLISGTNIKTINNESILGSGNIEILTGSTYDDTNVWLGISGNTTDISDLNNEFNTFTGTTYINGLNEKVDKVVDDGTYVKSIGYTGDIIRLENKDVGALINRNVSRLDISPGSIGTGSIKLETYGLNNFENSYIHMDNNVPKITLGTFTTIEQNQINIDIDNSTSLKRIDYNSDVSATYTNRSLIDKGYADTTYNDKLVSGTNIKTINNESILGSGNITISGGSSEYSGLTYNVVTGSTITANGSTTINLDNVDIQKIHFDGDIDYDINISGSTIGKVLTLVLTNEDEDDVTIDFSSNCEVFGTFDSLMVNAVSVICIGNDEFWVTIANK